MRFISGNGDGIKERINIMRIMTATNFRIPSSSVSVSKG
jgi:hypothetical protein